MIEEPTKRELASEVLRTLFADRKRVPIAEIMDAGAEVGVSRRTLQRAAKDEGLHEVHNGPFGAFWEK